MAKKIIIPTKSAKIKIVNRCIMCGKIIPRGYAICNRCDNKRIRALNRRR